MRKELMRNENLFKDFALAVLQSYKYMVSSFKSWDNKPPVCGCKKHLSEVLPAAPMYYSCDSVRPTHKLAWRFNSRITCGVLLVTAASVPLGATSTQKLTVSLD